MDYNIEKYSGMKRPLNECLDDKHRFNIDHAEKLSDGRYKYECPSCHKVLVAKYGDDDIIKFDEGKWLEYYNNFQFSIST